MFAYCQIVGRSGCDRWTLTVAADRGSWVLPPHFRAPSLAGPNPILPAGVPEPVSKFGNFGVGQKGQPNVQPSKRQLSLRKDKQPSGPGLATVPRWSDPIGSCGLRLVSVCPAHARAHAPSARPVRTRLPQPSQSPLAHQASWNGCPALPERASPLRGR